MTKTFRRVLGAVVMLGASSCVASAMTISYYVDVFSGVTTGTLCPGGSPGVAGTCPTAATAQYNNGSASSFLLTLPQFNQLGNAQEGTPSANHVFVLTGVQLALDWAIQGSVTVSNLSFTPSMTPTNVNFDSADAHTNMTLTAGGTQVVGAATAATGAGTVSYNNVLNGVNTFSPFGIEYLGTYTDNTVSGAGYNSQMAANLAYFQGFGANNFSAQMDTNAITASGSSNDPNAGTLTPFGTPRVTYGGSGQVAGIMTITYNYTEAAVPEPGTLALMGSALIGLGCLVRRKRMANR